MVILRSKFGGIEDYQEKDQELKMVRLVCKIGMDLGTITMLDIYLFLNKNQIYKIGKEV